MATFPSDSVRTKNWGTEVLTDADLEGQFDVIHTYLKDQLNLSTGHSHDGTANQGPKLSPANLVIASQAQGDILYAPNATSWARLGAGTAGQVLSSGGASANPSWITIGGVSGSFKNIKVTRPSVSTVTVTADELVLDSKTIVTSVNETIDITASGASGLDTGSEASLTWYYIWIIRKSSDGTVNGLLSTSASSPTMPAGYDQKALVSAVLNDGSSNFFDFKQEGCEYFYSAWYPVASGNVGASQTVDVTSVLPSGISTIARGTLAVSNGYVSVSNLVANVGDATTVAGNKFIAEGQNTAQIFWELNTITANTLYWCSAYASGALYVSGFRINKL